MDNSSTAHLTIVIEPTTPETSTAVEQSEVASVCDSHNEVNE